MNRTALIPFSAGKPVAIRGQTPLDFAMDAACTHSPGRHPDPHAVRHLLSQAEAGCRARGERWTAARRRVLELLLQAGGPMKAYELMAGFGEPGAPAKPPTVYRALEFLEEQSLVHRIAGLNAFIACGAEQGMHVAGFLICDCCGSADEFDPQLPTVAAATAQYGFQMAGATLEVHGRCRLCADEGGAGAQMSSS